MVANKTKCAHCPLRKRNAFREFSDAEAAFIQNFKTGELTADASTTIIVEGANIAHLYTLLSGWAFRYKILEDGRRQILNYIVPGDLIGLQGNLVGEMQHSVEALTPLELCVFERDRIPELFKEYHSLAYDMTWIAAREERILDEHLLSIGRRSALERSAYLLAFLHQRGRSSGLITRKLETIPITQHHVADTLGLSIVHTNKTLRKLRDRNLINWLDRGCQIIDADGLAELADWENIEITGRPFL